MPIPFDDPTEANPNSVVAWLRFVEDAGGRGIRAALFQTSAQGEPLEFCFTRIDIRDASRGNGKLTVLSSLAKSLFRATTIPPELMLGLGGEIPSRVFTHDLRVRLPTYLVRPIDSTVRSGRDPFGSRNGNSQRLLWATEQPVRASDARRVLDDLMEYDDPFEPFDRVARCMTEAFADSRVHDLTSVSGLNTVITLSPPPERSATHLMTERESIQATGERGRRDLTLVERLWATLAAPTQHIPSSSDIHLEWPGELMPFQQDGVGALLNEPQLLLADDMGLGKTIQAIAAIRILRARRQIDSCLVVAPASVLDQWRREISKWAPELSAIIIRGPAADRSWQWAANSDVTLVVQHHCIEG